VLGFKCGKEVHKRYKYINSMYGARKQFRMYVLVFRNQPLEISEKQKSYWQGGNKNEFVICLGYNTKTGRIDWCNPFSWCDKPDLEIATKRYFRENPKMNLANYPMWLESHLNLWKRKEFKDFEYIENELTKGQAIALFIIVFILNIVMSLFFIGNEETNEGMYDDAEIAYICISTIKRQREKIYNAPSNFIDWIQPKLDSLYDSYKNTDYLK
jgi:hypothetical protein